MPWLGLKLLAVAAAQPVHMLAQRRATPLDLWPRKALKQLTLQRTVPWPVPRLPAVGAGQ